MRICQNMILGRLYVGFTESLCVSISVVTSEYRESYYAKHISLCNIYTVIVLEKLEYKKNDLFAKFSCVLYGS